MHMCVHACIHMSYISLHVCIYVYTCIHMYVYICLHIRTHTKVLHTYIPEIHFSASTRLVIQCVQLQYISLSLSLARGCSFLSLSESLGILWSVTYIPQPQTPRHQEVGSAILYSAALDRTGCARALPSLPAPICINTGKDLHIYMRIYTDKHLLSYYLRSRTSFPFSCSSLLFILYLCVRTHAHMFACLLDFPLVSLSLHTYKHMPHVLGRTFAQSLSDTFTRVRTLFLFLFALSRSACARCTFRQTPSLCFWTDVDHIHRCLLKISSFRSGCQIHVFFTWVMWLASFVDTSLFKCVVRNIHK